MTLDELIGHSILIKIPRMLGRTFGTIDQRTCFHCVNAVEHELHFFIECPFYDDIRRKLFHKAQLCNRDFDTYSSTEKLVFLMNNINMQAIVASTLFSMFQRRKSVL